LKIYKVNPQRPEAGVIQAAAAVIRQGGVVAFPTTGLYGLGVDALNAAAVDRLFAIKQRPRTKPILLLVDSPQRLQGLVAHIPGSALRIMEHFWPGRVTIVFEAAAGIVKSLTAGSGKIGIRQAGHPVAAALLGAVDGPLTGTSANFSGAPACQRIEDLDPELARRLNVILDVGPLQGGPGSTIVDVTARAPFILREGTVAAHEILELFDGRRK